MRLLLDTHVWLWSLLSPEKLSPAVLTELESPDSELWLSPISAWEAHILIEKGRVSVKGDATDWVRTALRSAPLREAAVTNEVAIESRKISLPHQDPADRFIAATALVYDLTLVTADKRLVNAEGVSVFPS